MRNRCKHGYVIDPEDPCPECERDALREDNERLRAALEWIVGCALTEPEAMVEKARAALGEKA